MQIIHSEANKYIKVLFMPTFDYNFGWIVSFFDHSTAINWVSGDLILITQNPEWFSLHQFQLYNIKAESYVSASLAEYPKLEMAIRVMIIDPAYEEIWLTNDAIPWKVYHYDFNTAESWETDDIVIFGVNRGVDQKEYPYLLINLDTETFVRVMRKA